MARSFAIVAAGAAVSIGLSAAIVALGPGIVDVDTNVQIVGRTSPRLLDLLVALASGAAGAFALSREDVSDALPGVAIAISWCPRCASSGRGWRSGRRAPPPAPGSSSSRTSSRSSSRADRCSP